MIVFPVSSPIIFYSLRLCAQEGTINHLFQMLASRQNLSRGRRRLKRKGVQRWCLMSYFISFAERSRRGRKNRQGQFAGKNKQTLKTLLGGNGRWTGQWVKGYWCQCCRSEKQGVFSHRQGWAHQSVVHKIKLGSCQNPWKQICFLNIISKRREIKCVKFIATYHSRAESLPPCRISQHYQ